MKRQIKIWAIILFLTIISTSTLVQATELKNTKIDYLPYRELIAGEQGVVYKIKITNLGDKNKTYEIIPDSETIKEIGSYRIDPSDSIKIKPDEEKTLSFYLLAEKKSSQRKTIAVQIKSGNESTTINLVARPIGIFEEKEKTDLIAEIFRIVFSTIIIMLIIIAIIMLFKRIKRKKEKKIGKDLESEEEEIQTYY